MTENAPDPSWSVVSRSRTPAVTLVRRRLDRPPISTSVHHGADQTRLDVRGYATIEVIRAHSFEVHIGSEAPLSREEVVHPVLAFAASVISRWLGRTALHAASVELHGRAWIVLAPPDGGKSTFAAALDEAGHPVLAEDVTVIDGGRVVAGPRVCDLRPGAAQHLGRGRLVDGRGPRDRWRTELGPAPEETPLGGFVRLGWGEHLEASAVPPADRLAHLARGEALGLGPTEPTSFLDLLELPMYTLTRPRAWGQLDAAVELLVDLARP